MVNPFDLRIRDFRSAEQELGLLAMSLVEFVSYLSDE